MSLGTLIEIDVFLHVCRECGDGIPDPYWEGTEEDADEIEVTCSTCDAMIKDAYRRKKVREAHQRGPMEPPVCMCERQLADCRAERCWLDQHPPKPESPQGDLFG